MTRVPSLLRGAIAAIACLTAAASGGAQTVLKHSNWFPEGQVMRVKVIDPWKEEVAKVTNGRVRIETLPKVVGSVLGQFDVARLGRLAEDAGVVRHGQGS